MKLSYKFVSALAGLLVFALIAITAAAVIARYLLGTPIQWTEEMSAFLLIWIVFLGAIACEIEDQHLKIDVITLMLPKALERWLGVVVGLASVGLLGYMAWLGYRLAESAALKKTQILRMSWYWIDIAVTVGAIGIALVMLWRIGLLILNRPVPSVDDTSEDLG
ncbi:TRAP transporter small permease [Salipiger bermudensis]|uniref:TRAP transporter small permease n=1 Tax=Salipiger bermudensis TaxID=344736 RepID=UPI001CD592DF|nr:TRAP transporter small permease subunit [Salipiger bermudensis]MCA0963370.1 TRAP transporter small permease [Salipiger bermudensis]